MPKVLSEHHSLFDKSTFYFYQGNVKRKVTIFSNNFKSIPYYYEEKNSEKKIEK
jgi:hypothetical protein